MGRRLRTRLNQLHPDTTREVRGRQELDVSEPRAFSAGTPIFTRNHTGRKPTWVPGTIAAITGPLSYWVTLTNGTKMRRHVDQIRMRYSDGTTIPESEDAESDNQDYGSSLPSSPAVGVPTPQSSEEPSTQAPTVQVPPYQTPVTAPVRRSTRVSKPVKRFAPLVST